MACPKCDGELKFIMGGKPFPLHQCDKCKKFFSFTMVDQKGEPVNADGSPREGF